MFIFGCAVSLLLHGLFSTCSEQGLLSSCGVWASHCCGLSSCRAQALEGTGPVVVVRGTSGVQPPEIEQQVCDALRCPGLHTHYTDWSACAYPVLAGVGNPLNPISDGDQGLQLFPMNEEFPVSTGHKLALSPCPLYTPPVATTD